MTSNVGSEYFRQISSIGFDIDEEKEKEGKKSEEKFRERVMESLHDTFKPEFLNRLDEVIIFNALSLADIRKIVDIQLHEVENRLKTKEITLSVTPAVREYLGKNGFDPNYGARPIKRLIQKIIVDALADKIVRKGITHGKKISVTLNKSGVVEVGV